LFRVVRVRFENGVLRPLEKLDLHEGEKLEVVLRRGKESVAGRPYGVAKKRRPGLTGREFLEVLEEIGDENFRGL